MASPPVLTLTQKLPIKWTYGNLGNYYQADLTHDQIRTYYDAETRAQRSKLRKQIPATSWGEDLSESQALDCTGDRAGYLPHRKGVSRRYWHAVAFKWAWAMRL